MKNVMMCLIVVGMAVMASADTIQIYNGGTLPDGSTYGSTESLWLRSSPGDGINNSMLRIGNYGSGDVFRAPIRFNMLNNLYHGVDLGFTANMITGATLTLTTDTAFEGSGTCELRVLDSVDNGWTEMYTTWDQKRTDIPENWVGGAGASGYGDVIDTVSWMNPGGNAGPTMTPLTFDLTGTALDVVKDWVSGNDTSSSFILKSQTEDAVASSYLDFYSEASSYVPVLEITYDTSIPEPASVILLGIGSLVGFVRRKK